MKTAPRPSGFDASGRVFALSNSDTLPEVDADLWNPRLYCKASSHGKVEGRIHDPNGRPYAGETRAVCVRVDGGAPWHAMGGGALRGGGTHRFEAALDALRWVGTQADIVVESALKVPWAADVELWQITVRNDGAHTAQIDLFTAFGAGFLGLLDWRGCYDPAHGGIIFDGFPYYVKIEDYYSLRERKGMGYCLVDAPPQSWDASMAAYCGLGGGLNPQAVAAGRCGNNAANYEEGVYAFQHSFALAAGDSKVLRLALGPALDRAEIETVRRNWLNADWNSICTAACDEANCADSLRFLTVRSADPDFDAYLNHWQPNRLRMIGSTLRFNPSPQGRNAIQDAMAMSLVEPDVARAHFLKVWAHQHSDGWLPHGMPMKPGATLMPITTIPHKDTNVWGADAIVYYLCETADFGILDAVIPYADDGEDRLFTHICKGLDWLLADRTARGLSRIGQGDWNDPLNMAGPQGRGESIWLSQALAFALERWAGLCAHIGEQGLVERYRAEAEACRVAVRTYGWDGEYYCRAFTDAGRQIGGKADSDRLFLNTQSWAILAGVASDAEIRSMLQAVERTWTTRGPMLITPAYDGMVEDVGKLTLKTPGTGENGSVYCHGVTFWAYALFHAGYVDAGYRALRCLLPSGTAADIAAAGQLPIYLPNFYRGRDCGRLAGRSSRAPFTGTASWFARAVLEGLLGICPTLDGITLRRPGLAAAPGTNAAVQRRIRGQSLDIAYQRSADASFRVTIENVAIPANHLPYTQLATTPRSIQVSY